MKLSIIVPVYNTEKYIKRCAESLINQSVEDKEIIFIDDGSADTSGKICLDYAQKYDFVRVIRKENGGLSSARNAGLDIAKGEYIGFVDSDDCIHRDFYHTLINISEKYACDTVACTWQKFTDESEIKNINTENPPVKVYSAKDILIKDYSEMTHIYPTSVCVKVFRRKIFENLRFSEDIPYLEDVYLKPDILLRTEKFAFADLPLYYYFVSRGGSLVANRKNRKHSNIKADIHINRTLLENTKENRETITRNRLFSVLYTFSKMTAYYDREALEESRKEITDFYGDRQDLLGNGLIKYLYSLFIHRKYRLLKILCSLTFDIYKKTRQKK